METYFVGKQFSQAEKAEYFSNQFFVQWNNWRKIPLHYEKQAWKFTIDVSRRIICDAVTPLKREKSWKWKREQWLLSE